MKTNLMKSILHLKDDTEYQIPLRETEKDNRVKVRTMGTTDANPKVEVKKENEADVKDQQDSEAPKEEATATQLQDGLILQQTALQPSLSEEPTPTIP